MSSPLIVGQELMLEDTGEKVVFVKYAELEDYAYVHEPDLGEILVHVDELKPILEQKQIEMGAEIQIEQLQNHEFTPPSAGDKIELLLCRENLENNDCIFHAFLSNGKHELVELKFKWCIHGAYEVEKNMLLEKGTPMRIGSFTKADLSSTTHLWVQRMADKDLHWDPLKIKFSVQRLLFGETENGWMRRELFFVQKSLPNVIGKTKVKQIVRSHLRKGASRSTEINTIHNLALPMSKDLHLESLLQEGLSPGRTPIILFQVQEAEKYLNKAFMAGLKEIYLIHGIGEGALRMRLHEMLAQHPEIECFANEFHPRYGWGATVVRF
jgi:hypothetical protein